MKKNQNLFVIGVGIGIAMGVALHNVAVGAALGAGIGLALSSEANCSKGLFGRFKRS